MTPMRTNPALKAPAPHMPPAPQWLQARDAMRVQVCNGDADALTFLEDFMNVIEFWDDLIDGDVPVGPERINAVFVSVLVRFVNNRFWIENRHYLTPFMVMTISAWMDSEEVGDDADRRVRNVAFHIRNYGLELYHAVAFLTGGWDHLREMGPALRRFFSFEAFEDWEKEHGNG